MLRIALALPLLTIPITSGPATSASEEPLRVACIGDSITFGARIEARRSTYPELLSERLGPAYRVTNFGLGGATLLAAGDRPFTGSDAIPALAKLRPDIVVVILGTNDTCAGKRGNWSHADDLEADARAFVESLVEGGARVFLASPPPMFPEAQGLDDARRADLRERAPRLERIRRAYAQVARDVEGVSFLDLSRVLSVREVSDGVHPNPFGALAIAERVAAAIESREAEPLDLVTTLREQGIESTRGDFHGFAQLDFELDGVPCKLVQPHVPIVLEGGRPWIWRARFFDYGPQLDLALLDRGFHLAYVDVAGLFGSDQALDRWSAFHALACKLGLGQRVVLEGMSRGGLAIFNWASAHPDDVAVVYGDNPVCDFRSWPGGQTGWRSEEDWARCLDVYGLDEESAREYRGMPLDRLEPLARARVPVLLVLGTADEVVPPQENGERLASRYLELGGPVHVWRKPGAGHGPPCIDPIDPLVRAVFRSLGVDDNPATRRMPSPEYRGHPAGWGGGTWWDQLEKLRKLAESCGDVDLVFLGDSITQSLTGSVARKSRPDGRRPFDRFHGSRSAVSLGLSGDRTEHLLYRIEHGALQQLDPEVIVLQIGVNNVNAARHTGEETGAGVAAVVRRLREREAQAKVLICGPFPAGPAADSPLRTELDRVHAIAAKLDDDEHVFYRDLRPLFLDEDGVPNDRMRGDHLHITDAGYAAWMEALEPLLADWLAE